jgi:hypothetical protein
MSAKRKYIRYIVFLFCSVLVMALCSCQTSKRTSHSSARYQKERYKHQPHWNATTSQSTIYHIKKHFKRHPRDRKKPQY